MRILWVRNVHEALPRALHLLQQEGVERPSRNGPVLLGPPVTTIYEQPCERVLFWPERDANPFYHLYEALWMLAGRNDIAALTRYAKNVVNYSDDTLTWHGAYGYRWRQSFLVPSIGSRDQLSAIARRLRENPDDRRCVLQMWDTRSDLDSTSKDVPCNVIATFQRGFEGELNLTVFCRSNDIILGCYGANAVHFSLLLEYMALWIGCAVGTYTQISVNWHAYLDTFEKVRRAVDLRADRMSWVPNPYVDEQVHTTPLDDAVKEVDAIIKTLLQRADLETLRDTNGDFLPPWAKVFFYLLLAHEEYRRYSDATRYTAALEILSRADQRNDWIVAGTQWLQRREKQWQSK